MTFRIGQPVECIDASGAPELRRGGVYSIAAFCRCHKPPGVCLDGVELVGSYCSFDSERFRPERSTEAAMANLRQICAGHKERALA